MDERILNEEPKITKRKISLYNLINNTNYSLSDLGIRFINGKTYYYGIEYIEKLFDYDKLYVYKNSYKFTIDEIKKYINMSNRKYLDINKIENILSETNMTMITINHEHKTFSIRYDFIRHIVNYSLDINILPHIVKDDVLGLFDYEIVY
jgi:hypothetical protein